jgi:Zn-dependent M16 (insulinase) family peptidase
MKARYRVGGYIDEVMGGIAQLDTVKEMLDQAENDWPALLARLENMRSTILNESFCRDGMVLDITGDKAVLENVQPAVDSLLEELPGQSEGEKLPDFYEEEHPWTAPIKKLMSELVPIEDEGFVLPTQVSYVGKSGLLYDEGEEASGASQVVSKFLRTGVSRTLSILLNILTTNSHSHHVFVSLVMTVSLGSRKSYGRSVRWILHLLSFLWFLLLFELSRSQLVEDT